MQYASFLHEGHNILIQYSDVLYISEEGHSSWPASSKWSPYRWHLWTFLTNLIILKLKTKQGKIGSIEDKNLKETAEVRLMFSYIFASSYSGQCFAFQPIKTVQYFEKKQKKRYLLSIATTVNPIRVFLVKCELEKQLFEQKESKFVHITFVIFSSSSKTEYDEVQRNISRITHRHILSFLIWI